MTYIGAVIDTEKDHYTHICRQAYNYISPWKRSSFLLPRKSLLVSPVRSKILHCSQFWSIKNILQLEQVQGERWNTYYGSDYKFHLTTQSGVPLGTPSHFKNLLFSSVNFNILDFVMVTPDIYPHDEVKISIITGPTATVVVLQASPLVSRSPDS